MTPLTARFGILFPALLVMGAALAAPAGAPAGSTGQCKDGSYWNGPTKQGACRGHKGVQAWYGGAAPVAPAMPAAPAPAAMPAAPAAPAPIARAAMPAPAAPAAMPAPAAPAVSHRVLPQPAGMAAPGGGPGMVWVNSGSKVYHCPNDRWYGRTKAGSYMTEAQAQQQGYHGERNKPCK
jgi:hypothetical protein